jgi:hypothetical protein
MRSLTLLLVVCAAIAAQSALAQDQLAAIRAACADDAQRLCAGVPSGGGRIVACLKAHKDSLSDRCRQAAGLPANPSSSSAPSAATSPARSSAASSSAAASPAKSSAAPSSTATSPAKSSRSSAAGPSVSAATGAASGSYLRMKQVQIIAHVIDPALGQGTVDLPAMDLLIPSTWDFKGSVVGNSTEGCFSDFFAMSWEATSPDGSLAFQGAPNDSWQYADDPAELRKLSDPNRRQLGLQGKPCPVKKPMTAEGYFRQIVLTVFPKDSTVVSVEPFPELNQIARRQSGLPPADAGNAGGTRTDAIRAHVEFQKDGKALESWVTLAVVTRAFRQGRGSLYDCHAIDVMSLRASKGKLDANDKLFKVMISSIRPEPKWQAYSSGFIGKLYQAEAQKEASIDTMVANFQNQVAQTIMGVVANQQRGSLNSAFGADQNIRGVQTFRDPSTGSTMELSNQYDHAWLNGSNEYIMSDDPNFNPNGQLNGNWNQLQTVRPAP